MDIFFELHRDLPREGPGDNASTCRALAMLPVLPPAPAILDVGCGPGMQTLELARRTAGQITAVDTHQPFLDQLQRSARAAALSEQIKTVNMSMFELDFPDASFDLVWSEGAIYILGFERGLREWKRLLKPQGCLAVTELSWVRPDPPDEVVSYWRRNYPAMQTLETNLEIARRAGYREVGHFFLPDSSWWENYYLPQMPRIKVLRQRYQGDREAMRLLDETELEMDIFRRYSTWYGYVFYVMQK